MLLAGSVEIRQDLVVNFTMNVGSSLLVNREQAHEVRSSFTLTFPLVAPPVNVAVNGTSSPHCANAALIPSDTHNVMQSARCMWHAKTGYDLRSQRPFEILIVSPFTTGVMVNWASP